MATDNFTVKIPVGYKTQGDNSLKTMFIEVDPTIFTDGKINTRKTIRNLVGYKTTDPVTHVEYGYNKEQAQIDIDQADRV